MTSLIWQSILYSIFWTFLFLLKSDVRVVVIGGSEKVIVQLREIIMGNTWDWCRLPYGENKKGCPNYGKKAGCPPSAPLVMSLIERPYYLVYQRFDLAAQEKRMKEKHPKWTARQARNCRYWQKKLVKELLNEAEGHLINLEYTLGNAWSSLRSFVIVENPEGAGVNLFETCRRAGIILERDYLHQQYVYKMVLIGKRKKPQIPKIQRQLI